MEILVIYAEDCRDCEKAKLNLKKAISLVNKKIIVKYINCESQEAIDIAVEHKIYDIPACLIGNNTLCGKECLNYSVLLKAVEDFNRQYKI